MTTTDDYDPELAAMVLEAAARFEPVRNGPLGRPRALPAPVCIARVPVDEPRAPFRPVASVTKLRVGWMLWLACGAGHANFTDDSRVAKCKKMRCKRCGASTKALPAPRRRPSMEEIADAIGRSHPRAERTFDRDLLEDGPFGGGSGYSTGCRHNGKSLLVAVR